MRRSCFLLILICLIHFSGAAQPDTSSVTWYLNRTDSIGGWTTTALTQLPAIAGTQYGNAAWFDGVDDGFLVNCNPLGSATNFTVEVFFKPDSNATNNEQRFIHIRNASNDNRRVLLETRLLVNQRWILDTFIKSETSNLTLVDSSKTHSTGEWHHVALVYGSGIMHQYVDGIELLSGSVTYLPIEINGKTSIGARQDPRSWFKGTILMVKVTKRALIPSEFSFPFGSIINAGWNLVSIPSVQSDYNSTAVFPDLYGSMYEFASGIGYLPETNLNLGIGYWLYYQTPDTVTVTGAEPGSIIVNANLGWNIIGSRNTPVEVSNLVLSGGNTISGEVAYCLVPGMGYSPVTTISPGQGVWVYVLGTTTDFTITIP